jgi:hypothetical protein
MTVVVKRRILTQGTTHTQARRGTCEEEDTYIWQW